MGVKSVVFAGVALAFMSGAALADNGHCTLKPKRLPNGCMGVVGYDAHGKKVGFYRTAGRYAVVSARRNCPADKFDVIESFDGAKIKLANQAQLVLDDTCRQASAAK